MILNFAILAIFAFIITWPFRVMYRVIRRRKVESDKVLKHRERQRMREYCDLRNPHSPLSQMVRLGASNYIKKASELDSILQKNGIDNPR